MTDQPQAPTGATPIPPDVKPHPVLPRAEQQWKPPPMPPMSTPTPPQQPQEPSHGASD